MSAVIDINGPLEAANLAVRRAKEFGYGPFATAQMRRNAVLAANRGVQPVVAASRAVPRKCERNGDSTGPEAA